MIETLESGHSWLEKTVEQWSFLRFMGSEQRFKEY